MAVYTKRRTIRPTGKKWLDDRDVRELRDAAFALDRHLIELRDFSKKLKDDASLYPKAKLERLTYAYNLTREHVWEERRRIADLLQQMKERAESRATIPAGNRAEVLAELNYYGGLAQSSFADGDPWVVLHTLRRDLPNATPIGRDVLLRHADGVIARAHDPHASSELAALRRRFMSDAERDAVARRAAISAIEAGVVWMDNGLGNLAQQTEDARKGVEEMAEKHWGDLWFRRVAGEAQDAGDAAHNDTYGDDGPTAA